MKRLNNKIALITGGASGIGLAAARLFLEEGASVVLVDWNEAALTKATADLGVPDRVMGVTGDVSKEDDVRRYVDATVERFGRIDVFFNNAGIEGKFAPLTDQDTAEFDRVIAVNLRGVFLGLKYVLKMMVAQGSGSVINTSSVAGLRGFANLSPYVASKHAEIGLTRSAAVEVAAAGVRVNSIHPSPIDTPMMRSIEDAVAPDNPEAVKAQFVAGIPLGRYGEPVDVARLALFLASDEASFITGGQYTVDGGMVAA